MGERIRTVRADEFEEFMRFLERCYGHSRDFFPRAYPQLYRPDPDALECFMVLEVDGKIVSHVGLYPLDVRSFGCRVMTGGIGGVATLPEYRGRGYMSRLLRHAISTMRERGWPLSALGGDRQRYMTFGWERAGLKVNLTLTRRSLEWAGVKPEEVREVSPEEAAPVVERLHRSLPLRVERRKTTFLLRKQGVRCWLSEKGYVLTSGEIGNQRVFEVVSMEGREAELIYGVLERTFGGSATVVMSAHDTERLGRLLKAASSWSFEPDWQYRINDLYGLLKAFEPLLSERAKALPDLDISIGLRWEGEVDAATISVGNGRLDIVKGRESRNYLELDIVEGTRLILGGPGVDISRLGVLATLFPLPVHIPVLDHV